MAQSRGHFDRVRSDRDSTQLAAVEVLFIDVHFVFPLRDVRNIDFHRTVTQGFHELVVLETTVLGLVGVPDDHLINMSLGELSLASRGALAKRREDRTRRPHQASSTSTNSIMPRLATLNSPSKLKARGSESDPYSAILR